MNSTPRPAEPRSLSGLSLSLPSSPGSFTFFSSTSSPPSPSVNVSDGGVPKPDLPGQPPVLPPVSYHLSPLTMSGSSPLLVLRNALVDVRQQITSGILGAQDPAIMTADIPAPSVIRQPNASSDIGFDRLIPEQNARRLGGDEFVHNVGVGFPERLLLLTGSSSLSVDCAFAAVSCICATKRSCNRRGSRNSLCSSPDVVPRAAVSPPAAGPGEYRRPICFVPITDKDL